MNEDKTDAQNILDSVLKASENKQDSASFTQEILETKKLRHYASNSIATKYLPIYDLAIETFGTKELFIPVSVARDKHGFAVKPETLRHQLNEGLYFLCLYDLTDSKGQVKNKFSQEDYKRLRASIQFCLAYKQGVGDGITIKFKSRISQAAEKFASDVLSSVIVSDTGKSIGAGGIVESQTDEPLWKIKIDQFISDPDKRILALSGVKDLGKILTVDEIEMIKRIFMQLDNIEYDIGSTYIKAIK